MNDFIPDQPGKPATAGLIRWYGFILRLLMASLLVSIVAAEVFTALLAILWLEITRRGVQYKRTAFDVPILSFVIIRILSVVFSTDLPASIIILGREIPFYMVFFCAALFFEHGTSGDIRSVLRWLFVSTALVAAISTIQALFHFIERANGLTGGGTLSTHLVMAIAALIAFMPWKLFRNTAIPYMLLAIFLVGLVFTYTRGDWIAGAVVLLIYFAIFNRKLVLGLAIFAALAIVAVPGVRQRAMTLVHPTENTSDRIVLWQNARTHFNQHPILGFGPETFLGVFNNQEGMTDKHVGSWHNDAIQVYIESGILGLAGLVWILGTLAVSSIRVLKIPSQNRDPVNAIGWMGILLCSGYIICGAFSIPSFSITNAMLFRTLLAFVGTAALSSGAHSAAKMQFEKPFSSAGA